MEPGQRMKMIIISGFKLILEAPPKLHGWPLREEMALMSG